MGIDINAKFYKKNGSTREWKKILNSNANYLKCLCSSNMNIRLSDIDSFMDDNLPKNVGEYVWNDYKGIIENNKANLEFLEDNGFELYKNKSNVKGEISYIRPFEGLDKDVSKSLESKFISPSMEELMDKNKTSTRINIFFLKKEIPNGVWYNIDKIEILTSLLKKDLDLAKDELNRLKSIRESIDFYKLNTEEQERLFEDISYKEENLEYTEDKYDSAIRLREIMISLLDSYIDSETEEESFAYYSDVAVFIYAS